jgi:glutamyl-tRNA synthetase
MSKRDTEIMKEGGESIFIKDMKDMGYLPEAVLNWVALMGWSYDDQTEFFTLDDLIEKFSLDKLSPKNAAIDFKKFDHYNRLHIRNLEIEELADRFLPFLEKEDYVVDKKKLLALTPLLQPRVTTLDEVTEWVRFIFVREITPKYEDLIGKGLDANKTHFIASKLLEILSQAKQMTHEELEQPIRDLAEELGLKLGQVFGVLRIAISGQQVSPPLIESMGILGKEESLRRLQNAVRIIEENIKLE